jgi:hypothetical protein
MKPERIKRYEGNLSDVRDHQQNHENLVPERLPFLDDPPGALGE